MDKEQTEISSHNQATIESFNAQITQMDNEIEKLKNSIEDSARIFENIQQEMEDVMEKHRALFDVSENNSYQYDGYSYSTQTEAYESVSDEFKDNDTSNSLDKERIAALDQAKALADKKAKLEQDVRRMTDKYKLLKTNAILQKEKKMSEITRLYKRYKAAKAQLGGNTSIEMIVLDDADNSTFSKNISKIISKIDSSIIELRQDLE